MLSFYLTASITSYYLYLFNSFFDLPLSLFNDLSTSVIFIAHSLVALDVWPSMFCIFSSYITIPAIAYLSPLVEVYCFLYIWTLTLGKLCIGRNIFSYEFAKIKWTFLRNIYLIYNEALTKSLTLSKSGVCN